VIPVHEQPIGEDAFQLSVPSQTGGVAEVVQELLEIERLMLDDAENAMDFACAVASEVDVERKRVFDANLETLCVLHEVRCAIPPIQTTLADERRGDEKDRLAVVFRKDR
jgi:hypothetical protein